MGYTDGVDETMSWTLKAAYAACVIVVGFMLRSRLVAVAKVVNNGQTPTNGAPPLWKARKPSPPRRSGIESTPSVL